MATSLVKEVRRLGFGLFFVNNAKVYCPIYCPIALPLWLTVILSFRHKKLETLAKTRKLRYIYIRTRGVFWWWNFSFHRFNTFVTVYVLLWFVDRPGQPILLHFPSESGNGDAERSWDRFTISPLTLSSKLRTKEFPRSHGFFLLCIFHIAIEAPMASTISKLETSLVAEIKTLKSNPSPTENSAEALWS